MTEARTGTGRQAGRSPAWGLGRPGGRRGLCLHVVLWAAGASGGHLLEGKCRGRLCFTQRIPAQRGFVLVTPGTPRCGAGSQPQHRGRVGRTVCPEVSCALWGVCSNPEMPGAPCPRVEQTEMSPEVATCTRDRISQLKTCLKDVVAGPVDVL